MPDFNPYAYTEESEIVFPQNRDGQTSEPLLPLTMELFQRTGLFSSRPCQLLVTDNQLEISGMHLQDPITVQRYGAYRQIKLRLLDMKIRGDDGRKCRLRYPKADPEKNLTLARLETWLNPHATDDPETANRKVDRCLKKWACKMVTHYISFLLVLQVIGLILITIGAIVSYENYSRVFPDHDDEVGPLLFSVILVGSVALMVLCNAAFLIFIRLGKIGILYFVIVLYSLFCLSALMTLSFIAVAFGGLVVYYSVKANIDYRRLRHQIGGIIE